MARPLGIGTHQSINLSEVNDTQAAALRTRINVPNRSELPFINATLPPYSAVGDGVADDTAAIQAAINSSSDRMLYIPRGIYKITSTISIPTTGRYRIIGDSFDNTNTSGTVINFTGTTGPAVRIQNTSGSSSVLMERLSLNGVIGNTGVTGLYINNGHFCQFNNLWISNFGLHGVHAYDAWGNRFDKLVISQNGGIGMYLQRQANNVIVRDCIINGNSRRNGWANIWATGSAGLENLGLVIDGCDFTDSGPSSSVETVTDSHNIILQHTHSVEVRGCYSEHAKLRLMYADSTVKGLILTGTYFQDGKVLLDSVDGLTVDAVTLRSTGVASDFEIKASGGAHHRIGSIALTGGSTKTFGARAGQRREFFDTAAPSSGTYEHGDVYWHKAPYAGGPIGWVCTSSGSPGTWKVIGTIAT